MNKKNAIKITIGVIMFVIGLYVLLVEGISRDNLISLPFVLIGIGSGVFGAGMGEVLKTKAIKEDPVNSKRIEIEQKDERNTAIANKARAKSYSFTIILFAAVILLFTLLQADTKIVLVLVAAYIASVVSFPIYYSKLNKEM
jgi:hypothetical protein